MPNLQRSCRRYAETSDVITARTVDMLNLKTAEKSVIRRISISCPIMPAVWALPKNSRHHRPDYVVMTIGEEFGQNGHQYSDNLHNALAANPDVKFYYTAKQGYSFTCTEREHQR